MITVTCEPYVLCSRCDGDGDGCDAIFTCEVMELQGDVPDADIPKTAIEQAIKYGDWQIIGDEIYCPACAEVMAKPT